MSRLNNIGKWVQNLTPEQRCENSRSASRGFWGPKKEQPPRIAERVWTWPERLARYDSRPDLTDLEKTTLARYGTEYRVCRTRKTMDFGGALDRLVEPLDDVFVFTGTRTYWRSLTIFFMLREMARRTRSYWAWSNEEWIETMAARKAERQHLIAAAYLLCGFSKLDSIADTHLVYPVLAKKVFGREHIEQILERVNRKLDEWGYSAAAMRFCMRRTVCEALLQYRTPFVEDLTYERLLELQKASPPESCRRLVALSRVLHGQRLIDAALRVSKPAPSKIGSPALRAGIAPEWVTYAQRWYETSTGSDRHRRRVFYLVLSIGRWLAATHGEVVSPADWNRDLAAQCVTLLANMKCGDWSENRPEMIRNHGRLIAPGIRVSAISSVRCYFRDLQNWELIPRRFDPLQAFSTPKNLLSQIGPDPRVIADDVWAKLVWAGLNLVEDDLPLIGDPRLRKLRKHCYPFALVKALAIIWLFTGLRSNEIMRLRVGCVRWQPGNSGREDENRERAPVCFLDVPVNKTGPAFTKPVDRLVGEAVNAWEQLRPPQEKLPDPKTGQMVEFLFLYRMNRVGRYYLNKMVIPLLCSKAGVPRADVRGNFTAHRARSTIASQLFNAKEPMSLTDLQQWLGHKTPNTTRFYAQVTPTRLAQSFRDAAYFTRNLRAIEVLIDQNVVRAGLGDRDLWKYYDLGHGYCTYDFFDQCPHRMACAKCDFYLPKESSRAQLLEGKAGLLRMQQQIPLRDSEIAAVTDGIAAYEALLTTLTDTPTPAGLTPRQIEAATLVNITMSDKEAQHAPAIRQAEKQR